MPRSTQTTKKTPKKTARDEKEKKSRGVTKRKPRAPPKPRARKSLHKVVGDIKKRQDDTALTLDVALPTQRRFCALMFWLADPDNKYQWNKEAFQRFVKTITMVFKDVMHGVDTVRSQSGISSATRPDHVDKFFGSHPSAMNRFASVEPAVIGA